MVPFRIDEEALGVSTDEFCAALTFEGMHVNRHYLPCPVFELEVIKKLKTYGSSGYPFTAFPYAPPDVSEFPGFSEFHDRTMTIYWSNHVRTKHSLQIARTFSKVVKSYRRNVQPVPSGQYKPTPQKTAVQILDKSKKQPC